MNLPILLIAEDDADDRLFISDALEEVNSNVNLKFVHDGEQLIEYLENQLTLEGHPDMPSIIILDLNMPKVDGREALKFVKSHRIFRSIPTLVLTTSKATEDIVKTYNLGVNSFVTNPSNYSEMVHLVSKLNAYWFTTVELPSK